MLDYDFHEVNKVPELVVGKNPLSVVHEYCQVNNLRPSYVVDDEEGSQHSKLFTITCTVSDMKTTGVGKSKKEAKLSAATSMVELLKTNGIMDPREFEGKRRRPTKRMKLSEDFLVSKIAENPVGFLQEYCLSQEMTLPSYIEEPSHFGYSISCTVNDISCQGLDHKKKRAKADAAKKMCEMLIKKKSEVNNNENEHTEIEGKDQTKNTLVKQESSGKL